MAPLKENPKTIDLAKLETEYAALRSLADSFCKELTSQISRVLEDQGIALGFPIQSRVKTWESLAEKLERISLRATRVTDVQDLVGLRLILLFKRDISRVCEQIEQYFSVIRRYNTQERLKDDQFGYSSIHFVIEIPEQWLAVPTLAPLSGLRAEIQVRTVAQHMWAETSQALQYKSKEGVPSSVTRAIHRVSALLETVDLEFERVLEQRDAYRTKVEVTRSEGTLNVDLLEKTLDALLPPSHKGNDEDYAELLDDLTHFAIRTTEDLKNLIDKRLNSALETDSYFVTRQKKKLENGEMPIGTTPERVRRGVFFTHTGLTREALDKEFPDLWEQYQENKYFQHDYEDEQFNEPDVNDDEKSSEDDSNLRFS